MLIQTKLYQTFWEDAVMKAAYLVNRSPSIMHRLFDIRRKAVWTFCKLYEVEDHCMPSVCSSEARKVGTKSFEGNIYRLS